MEMNSRMVIVSFIWKLVMEQNAGSKSSIAIKKEFIYAACRLCPYSAMVNQAYYDIYASIQYKAAQEDEPKSNEYITTDGGGRFTADAMSGTKKDVVSNDNSNDYSRTNSDQIADEANAGGKKTENQTEENNVTEKVYDDADSIQEAQIALNALGFDCGIPDGIAGKATASAIMEYAASKGLSSSDGELTAGIVDSLIKDKAAYDEAHPQTVVQELSGTHYVLNTHTMKFHYSSCDDVDKIKQENRSDYTGTRDEVMNFGYSSCGHCHP